MSNTRGFPKGINTEGLLTDVYEDEGYEHWDLLITVLEILCTDVNNCIQEEDKDHLYALINLLNSCNPDNLMRFLPKEGTPYDPDRCKELGEYRLNHQNFIDPDASMTVTEFLEKFSKSPEPKPKSVYPENDNYFMSQHYPEDYKIPEAVNQALVFAKAWADTDTDKSVNKQVAQTYLMAIPQAILEGHEMGMGSTPISRIESGLKTQILYILANLQGWRGEEARQYKKVLKAFHPHR